LPPVSFSCALDHARSENTGGKTASVTLPAARALATIDI